MMKLQFSILHLSYFDSYIRSTPFKNFENSGVISSQPQQVSCFRWNNLFVNFLIVFIHGSDHDSFISPDHCFYSIWSFIVAKMFRGNNSIYNINICRLGYRLNTCKCMSRAPEMNSCSIIWHAEYNDIIGRRFIAHTVYWGTNLMTDVDRQHFKN